MTITQEQRTWARLAGILFHLNYVFQGLGDYPTIIARLGVPGLLGEVVTAVWLLINGLPRARAEARA